MFEQRAEEMRAAGETAGARAGGADEGREIGGSVVRERVALGVAPDEFDGVEFGGVWWQQFGLHLRMGGEPALDHPAAMRVAAIPDNRARVTHEPPQVPEEGADRRGVDTRVGRKPEVAPDPIAARRDDEGRDDRHLLARAAPLIEGRRLPARRPGAPHERGDQDPRFVNEDERGSPARGVFFTCGQRVFTHRAIAASSRSSARRAGCWGLHPKACSTRPM